MKTKNILIAGGSGMIGQALTAELSLQGYDVAWLSRKNRSSEDVRVFQWDIHDQFIEAEALEWADVVINLAGAPIARWPWTESYKQKVIASRTLPAALLSEKMKACNSKPQLYISASATGIYGDRKDEILTENSKPGNGFLPKSCMAWEEQAEKTAQHFERSAIVRTGIVLSNDGGFLKKLLPPAKVGIMASPGSGSQYLPWIHINDLCRIYTSIIQNSNMHGTYNASAPKPVTMKFFLKELCKTLNSPFWLPAIPAFLIRLALGEMSQIVLDSANAIPEKLLNEDFKFQNTDLNISLKTLLKK